VLICYNSANARWKAMRKEFPKIAIGFTQTSFLTFCMVLKTKEGVFFCQIMSMSFL